MFNKNKWLIGVVIAIAVMAIGFYVYRFWGKPLSADPGDWADFATYISGTVGVGAVVATLLAFVQTLGQQQALIESQDKMLDEQKNQIELTKIQNDELRKKHDIEVAYSNTKEVFPSLFSDFNFWLKDGVTTTLKSEDEFRFRLDSRAPAEGSYVRYVIEEPYFLAGLLDKTEKIKIKNYLDRFFAPIERLYRFVCVQVSKASALEVYYDVELWGKDDFEKKFVFHCYQAFLIGCDNDLYHEGVLYLNLDSDYTDSHANFRGWQKLGYLLKEV